MAIKTLTEGSPYIHSSIWNFHAQAVGSNINSKEYSDKIIEKITQLEGIRESLYNKAFDFCGGEPTSGTLKDIWAKASGDNAHYVEISRKILYSSDFYKEINKEAEEITIPKDKISEKIVKELRLSVKEGKDGFEPEQIKAAIKKKLLSKKSKVGQKNFLSLFNFDEELLNDYLGENKQKIIKKHSNKITRIVDDAISRSGISTQLGDIVAEVFSKRFNNLIELYPSSSVAQLTKDEFLSKMGENLRTLLNGKPISTISSLKGYGSEEMIKALAESTVTDKKLTIEIVGSKTTEKDWKDAGFSKEIESLSKKLIRSSKKQSYSDLIITYNNQTVRVQAKNELSYIDAFFEEKRNITQHTHLFRDESLPDFLERLKDTPFSIDQEELAYNLSNVWWFMKAGSIGKNGQGGEEVHYLKNYQNYFDLLFSDILINYLGILIGDDYKVITDLSNVFFLLDGLELLPTYKIIDGLILNLKKQKSELSTIKVRIKGPNLSKTSAKKLLQDKLDKVGSFNKNDNYTDPRLLSVGKAEGENIISGMKIKSFNLETQLQSLLKSSFSFEDLSFLK